MIYRYEIYVATDQEYASAHIGGQFRGGVVVDGLAGLGEDQLIVTAHSTPGVLLVYDEGHDFTEKEIIEWGK